MSKNKALKIDVIVERDGGQFTAVACMGKYAGGAFRRDSCGMGSASTPTAALGKATAILSETLLKRSTRRGVRRSP